MTEILLHTSFSRGVWLKLFLGRTLGPISVSFPKMQHEFFPLWIWSYGALLWTDASIMLSFQFYLFSLAIWTKKKNNNKKNPLISHPCCRPRAGKEGHSVGENVLVLGKPALTAVPCAAQQMARVCWWFFFSKVIELLDTVRRAQLLSGARAGNRYFLVRKGQRSRTDVLGWSCIDSLPVSIPWLHTLPPQHPSWSWAPS